MEAFGRKHQLVGVEVDGDYEDYVDEEDEDEVLDPIDGCTEENVGWMKLQASTSIGAESYLTVYGYRAGGWYVAYQRTHELVMWRACIAMQFFMSEKISYRPLAQRLLLASPKRRSVRRLIAAADFHRHFCECARHRARLLLSLGPPSFCCSSLNTNFIHDDTHNGQIKRKPLEKQSRNWKSNSSSNQNDFAARSS